MPTQTQRDPLLRVRYIGHSGFLVETERDYWLFDYYTGALPPLDPGKPVTVLASHGHKDHYNPAVFGLLREAGAQSVSAVLAKDIPPRRFPPDVETLRAYPGQSYELPRARVETLCSTDCGVAYLLTTEGGVLYHAGDLNDWSWARESDADNRAMRARYRAETDKLAGRRIDAAFVPLDPRQARYEGDGLLYFLETTEAKRVYPMHYWARPDVIARFLQAHPQYAGRVLDTERMKGEDA